MAIEKIKILGAVLELPAKQHCQIDPFTKKSGKTAPRILIFSTAMGIANSFYVKSIASYSPTFFGYITSVLAIVNCKMYVHM